MISTSFCTADGYKHVRLIIYCHNKFIFRLHDLIISVSYYWIDGVNIIFMSLRMTNSLTVPNMDLNDYLSVKIDRDKNCKSIPNYLT